jgi:hypothetical protein
MTALRAFEAATKGEGGLMVLRTMAPMGSVGQRYEAWRRQFPSSRLAHSTSQQEAKTN